LEFDLVPLGSPHSAPSREDEPPALGEKTTSAIFALLQDFYRQEVGAEEDIHRTLPFFATALGLIVASLNYSATQLPSRRAILTACARGAPPILDWTVVPCAWSALLAGVCLLFVVGLSGTVLWYLGLATRKRDYLRAGPEQMILERARELHSFHAGTGVDGDRLDMAVMIDIRAQLLETFAEVVPANREVSSLRYRYRARAVLCLLWSLFFALLATILVIVTVKFSSLGA
jgi:hypothetical protein